MKKLLLVYIFLLSCSKEAPLPPDTERPPGTLGIVVTASGLNLRDRASPDAQRITTLPYKTELELMEQKKDYTTVNGISGKWTRVRSASGGGWVLAAPELLAITDSLRLDGFGALEAEGSVFDSPSLTSTVLTTFKHGDPIRLLSDSIEIGKLRWHKAEVGAKQGYVLAGVFTTVHIPFADLSEGPFVGLKYTALPEFCSSGSGFVVDESDTDTNGNNLALIELRCNGRGGYVLQRASRAIGRVREHEVLQYIPASTVHPERMVLTALALTDFMCSDRDGNRLQLARINTNLGSHRLRSDKFVVYSDVVVQAWQFDKATQRMREVKPEGAGCVVPPASMFD